MEYIQDKNKTEVPCDKAHNQSRFKTLLYFCDLVQFRFKFNRFQIFTDYTKLSVLCVFTVVLCVVCGYICS
jgi:hypothetical protein